MAENNKKEILQNIRAFAFDVDGVFTDGSVILYPGGEYVREMNIKDGYAVQYCVKQGFPIAIITGGNSDMVKKRFENLGVSDIYMKSGNKLEAYDDFRFKYNLDHSQILYMGDDLPDYEVMTKAGFPACPADAVWEIREISHYISYREGGKGCVRDVIEQVLRMQNKWMIEGSFLW